MTRSIFFTDLDGTFLDHDTYDPGPSVAAARRLVRQGVQLAFCSSKTLAEQAAIRDAIELPVTMIVENGSAIYRPESSAPEVLGCRVGRIREVAGQVRRQTGINLRLMGEADVAEVMLITGLGPTEAACAQRREFSESIVWPRGDRRLSGQLADAFGGHGLSATEGGRFLTVHGPDASKGRAVARLLAGPAVVSGAVGDGPNDVSMLAEVDFPYLVSGGGARPSDLSLPRLKLIRGYGPAGFAEAAADFLLVAGLEPAPGHRFTRPAEHGPR